MSSVLRSESSRANGAKSRGPVTPEGKLASAANARFSTGPVTPEGKARSSQNALTHGILSQTVVLPSESWSAFEKIYNGYMAEFEPATDSERRLVQILAVADWRRTRVWSVETAQLTHALHIQERLADSCADQENSEIPSMHTALAWGTLNDSSTMLQNLNRYEVRYAREYMRALSMLEERRAARQKNQSRAIRTEPNIG
jgi:hypothetical protein